MRERGHLLSLHVASLMYVLLSFILWILHSYSLRNYLNQNITTVKPRYNEVSKIGSSLRCTEILPLTLCIVAEGFLFTQKCAVITVVRRKKKTS